MKNIFNNKNKLFTSIILFSLLRLYIGYYTPYWYRANGMVDDLLLLTYSNLSSHFLNWNSLSLAKTISYPLFLFIVKISQIPYSICLTLLWIFAGLLTIYAIYKFIFKNKLLLILTYIFIIFLPIAFDVFSGLRIYRNTIMPPMIIIVLSSLFIFISLAISKNKNIKQLILWAVIVGLLFTFNFYIKEDGILTLPILIASILMMIIFNIYEFKSKKFIKYSIIFIIPLLIFGTLTLAYKEVNNYYFGVNEITTRLDGEIGEFWQNLLKIDDSNKTNEIWVPASTLKKAWNASPTLQSRQDLLEPLLKFQEDNNNTNQNKLKGDHITWRLRDCLRNVGLYDNEKEANDFFKTVNNELDDAFENGKLNKSDKIFITGSATGKSLNEIMDIKTHFISGLNSTMFYGNIEMKNNISNTSEDTSNDNITTTEKDLNQHLIKKNEIENPTLNQKIALDLIEFDIISYQMISYLIVLLSSISFIYSIIFQLKNKFKNRINNALVLFEFMLLGTFILQMFAIAWFCSWLNPIFSMKYYTVADQGIFVIFEILTITGAIKIYSSNKLDKTT